VHRLNPISPLGTKQPIKKEFGPYTIEEVNSNALASYSFRKGTERDAKKNVEQFMAGPLPDAMSSKFGKISSFWIGPSQWLIEAPIDIYEDLASELTQISAGTASVTEQTDAWCRFDLMGANLAEPLSLLCNVDVPLFEGGEITRCQMEHMGCFLICRDLTNISILGPRSAAESLYHAITAALGAVA
jgi:sarcosine oxidase subunit gamma